MTPDERPPSAEGGARVSQLDRVKQELPPLMADVATLQVPLVVDVGSGVNWDKAH